MYELILRKTSAHTRLLAVLIVAGCLTLGLAVAGQLILNKIRKNEDGGGITLTFKSNPESYCEIWRSDALEQWELVGMALGIGGGGEQEWTDVDGREASRGFYRIVQKPLTESGDADGDGFDDVYELNHAGAGLSPVKPNPVTVASVTVASTEIAAGALDSEPHQTEVRIQVNPPGAYPVAVWLGGGAGYGSGTLQHFVGGEISKSGPATLRGDGQAIVAGGPEASENAILVTPNARGEAVLVLTSSNRIGEQCTVHARAGTSTAAEGSQAQSTPVTSEKGALQVDLPGLLVQGSYATAVLRRRHNGKRLAGHRSVFFVSRVKVDGVEIAVDPANPGNLDAYARIASGEEIKLTNANGTATADVYIGTVEGLEKVEVEAQDLEVFED